MTGLLNISVPMLTALPVWGRLSVKTLTEELASELIKIHFKKHFPVYGFGHALGSIRAIAFGENRQLRVYYRLYEPRRNLVARLFLTCDKQQLIDGMAISLTYDSSCRLLKTKTWHRLITKGEYRP